MRILLAGVVFLTVLVLLFMYRAPLLQFFGDAPCDPEHETCEGEENYPEIFDITQINTIILALEDIPGGRVEIRRDESSAQSFSARFLTANPSVEGSVMLMTEHVAYRNTTGDVFIPYAIDYGGSGYFISVGVFTFADTQTLSLRDYELLGDRILLDGVSLTDTGVAVDYRDRTVSDPMAALPTVPKVATIPVSEHIFGEKVVEDVPYGATYKDLIRVTAPITGAPVATPLTIEGEARGQWYFEATFPVTIVDWDGVIIGEGYAEAQREWMTTDYVPFLATVTFVVPDDTPYRRGAVILQKSNASGLPEHDDAFELPVTFE